MKRSNINLDKVGILIGEGYTQEEIAKLYKVNQSTISRLIKTIEKVNPYIYKPEVPDWYKNIIGGETKIRVDKEGRMPWQR